MTKKNKKKRNTNHNKAAAEESPGDITHNVSQISLEDRAWAVESREGDTYIVTTRDMKPLEVVIEDTATITVPVIKVCTHQDVTSDINEHERYIDELCWVWTVCQL